MNRRRTIALSVKITINLDCFFQSLVKKTALKDTQGDNIQEKHCLYGGF